MTHTTLAWFTALSLLGSATLAAAQQPAEPAPQPPATASQPASPPASPKAGWMPQPPAAQAGPGRPAPANARSERRRRSYAACNRASHQRGLRGGKRRRFLIRCRLGYERTRQPPAIQAGPQAPAPAQQPGRRP